MIFTHFVSSTSSKFSWHSSFNVAGSKCSFYCFFFWSFSLKISIQKGKYVWFYHFWIFFLLIIFTKNINTEGKTHVIFTAFKYFFFWSFLLKISTQKEKHMWFYSYTLFHNSRCHLVNGAKSHVCSVNPTNLVLWFEELLAIWCHLFFCFSLLDLWFIIKTKVIV